MNLGASLPIYVTRPHGAQKVTTMYSMTFWQSGLAIFVVWLNIVCWGLYGLIQLAGKVI